MVSILLRVLYSGFYWYWWLGQASELHPAGRCDPSFDNKWVNCIHHFLGSLSFRCIVRSSPSPTSLDFHNHCKSLPVPVHCLYCWTTCIHTCTDTRWSLSHLFTMLHKTMQLSSGKLLRPYWLSLQLASSACPRSYCSCIWPARMNQRSPSLWSPENYGTGLLQYSYVCELQMTALLVNCNLRLLSFGVPSPLPPPLGCHGPFSRAGCFHVVWV